MSHRSSSLLARRSHVLNRAVRACIESLEPRKLLSTTGITGEYFAGQSLAGNPIIRDDANINFNWGTTAPPSGVTDGNFSTRWEGKVTAPDSGTYTFYATVTGGERLWINGTEVLNDWTAHSGTDTGTITLSSGTTYSIRMEYFDNTAHTSVELQWASTGGLSEEAIPQSSLVPLDAPAASYVPKSVDTTTSTSSAVSGAPNWYHSDIDESTSGDTTTYSGGTFTVTGAGTLIGGVNDQFQYADQLISGDFTLIAHTQFVTDPNGGSETGIMIRTGLGSSSPEVFIGAQHESPSGVTYSEVRTNQGAAETSEGVYEYTPNAYWFKLVRYGDEITGYYSVDGTTWTQWVSQALQITGDSVYAGLAVASRTTATCTATFDNVSVTGNTLQQETSYIGNSLPGGNNSIMTWAAAAYVNPSSGMVYLNGTAEDKSVEVLNPDGSVYAMGDNSHYTNGSAIAVDSNFIYAGQNDAGVQRYTLLGNAEGTSVLGTDQITGLATGNGKFYVAANGMIYVFNQGTLANNFTDFTFANIAWAAPNAANIAIDPSGNLWVVQDGTTPTIGHYNGDTGSGTTGALLNTITLTGSNFPNAVVPVGIAVDMRTGSTSGQVYVTDIGKSQDIDIFNSNGTFDTTFGTLGGIYSGTDGAVANLKFNYPIGVGIDLSGNITVVNAGPPEQWGQPTPGTGTVIDKFSSAQTLLWQRTGLAYVDTAAADPANPTSVYTKFYTYNVNDNNTQPGTEASVSGTLVDPFAYPTDPRLVGTTMVTTNYNGTDYAGLGGESARAGVTVVDLYGTKYLYDFDQHSSAVNVYRFLPNSDITVFCGEVLRQIDRHNSSIDGFYIWTDANGDGVKQASEESIIQGAEEGGGSHEDFGWYVDSNGNIWTVDGGTNTIREFKVTESTMSDGAVIPSYSYSNMSSWAVPTGGGINIAERVVYTPSNDTLYLTGYTADYPKNASDGASGMLGSQLFAYSGWVNGGNNGAGATALWAGKTGMVNGGAVLPYTYSTVNSVYYSGVMKAMAVAGNYVFTYWGVNTEGVNVYNAATGASVTTLAAGPEVAGGSTNGPDFTNSLTASYNSTTGQYTLFGEEVEEAKVLMFRWTPGQTLPAENWFNEDIGSPTIAGSSSYNPLNSTWTLTGEGSDIYGTSDQFQFDSQSLSGDGEVIADVTSLTNTNVWAKAGVMFRDGTAANAAFANVDVTPGEGVTFQWRTAAGGSANNTTVSGITAPEWVKIERQGNSFTGYYSSNGTSWTQIGSAESIIMATDAHAGLAVCSHTTSESTTATFTNVQVSQPLADTDIGSPSVPGSGSFDPYQDTYTLMGDGSDIYNTADQFNYDYESFTGDGAVIARVDSVSDTNNYAKAGVMFRDGTAAGAIEACIVVTPAGGAEFEWRGTTNGTTSYAGSSGIAAPEWVKLVRSGNNFSAYESVDGINWTQVGSTQSVAMPTAATVGLAVSSHVNGTLATGVFSDVSIT